MDLTIGSIVGKIAEGLPVAVGLILIIMAGSKGLWRWSREVEDLNASWQRRYDDSAASALLRLTDVQASCKEWKEIANRTIGAAEKIVPAMANKSDSK